MLPVQTPEITYAGNGSTVTAYPIPFRYDATSWVRAEVIDSAGVVTALALGSGFTLSGDGSLSSGTLRTVAAVVNSSTVRIYRATPKSQETALVYNGVFSSANIERAFDKVTMIAQDLGQGTTDLSDRAIRVPNGETVNELPAKAARLKKYMRFNETTGQPEMVTAAEILAESGGAPDGVGIPAGGLEGEVLTKTSDTSFQVGWRPIPPPPGVFANDVVALANGVGVGYPYRKPAGELVWRQLIPVTSIALFGDSITEQGSSGLLTLNARGYQTWARLLGGSRWDPVPNGSSLDFATSGFRTDQLIATQLPAVLVSGASVCTDQSGLNDILQSVPTATIVANRRDIWAQCVGAGIQPIALTITAIPLGSSGVGWNNADGSYSAAIAETNVALKAAALEDSVPLYDYAAAIELVPDSGIANPIYMETPLDIHQGILGAYVLGRSLAEFMDANFAFTSDPLVDEDWITNNVAFAGPSGSPTGWSIGPLSDGTVDSKTTEEGGTYDWLRINVTGGAGSFIVSNFNANIGGSPVGKEIDSVAEVEIISGNFWVGLNTVVNGGSGSSWDNFIASTTPYPLSAGDSVILRTPQSTVGVGATTAVPAFYFRCPLGETGTIRVRRVGTREL